ncbi:hypothetical protein CL648_01160 [bacterium]|nr:hypothetical protein [bacterium]
MAKIFNDFKSNNFDIIDRVLNGLCIHMDHAKTRILEAEARTEKGNHQFQSGIINYPDSNDWES